MSFPGELYEFIRERKHYWLLPVLIPILVFHELLNASKNIMGGFQNLRSVSPSSSSKLHNGLVVTWSRLYLRHSRRA